MEELQFEVPGIAQPGGSKRALPLRGKKGARPIIVDANAKARPWKDVVIHYARKAMLHGDRKIFSGPVALCVRFALPRPKYHYGAGGKIKASAPGLHTKKPDVLKLARALEDALTEAGVWIDDAQIVDEQLRKVYDSRPHVLVGIRQLSEEVMQCGRTSSRLTDS